MARSTKKLTPIHPGEILREDFLRPLGLSANRLALDIHVPVTRITDILRGRRTITTDTALRLARYFGITPEFWLNLQRDYELEVAQDTTLAIVEREVRPRMAARTEGRSPESEAQWRSRNGSSEKLLAVLHVLRKAAPRLQQLGVKHLSLFGSTARGTQRLDSDLDLLLDLDARQPIDLLDYAGIVAEIQKLVPQRVDVARRNKLKSHVAPDAVRDEIHVF